MASQDAIVSQMRAQLAVTDPELDTSQGTTTRKILDVVGEAVSEAYVDEHISSYQYDIDSKTGGDLDAFVQIFGMARISSRRSQGALTFTRPKALNAYQGIPLNTIVGTLAATGVTVSSLAAAIIAPGQTTVTVPAQATVGGTTGNIGAGQFTQLITNIQGVSVTNTNAFTGGADAETDDALRIRWKKTVFRSLVGTEDMYRGIALDDVDCYAANVIGASKVHREQISVVSGVAQATMPPEASSYNYETSVVVGPNIDAGQVFLLGYDYTVVTGVNPIKIQSTGSQSRMVDGFYDISYEYTPTASRNIPGKHINNRVDVWVAGNRDRNATQMLRWDASRVFSNTSTDVFYNQKYVRLDSSHPSVNNIFLPLHFGPINSLPTALNVGGFTYHLNTDYWIVHRDDAFGWTSSSLFGIEWKASSTPVGNPLFTVGSGYAYNDVVSTIQSRYEDARMVGIDAKVHQAKSVFLRFNLVVMYAPNASIPTVKNNIANAISARLNQNTFGSVLQASDILTLVGNVNGIDNVRFRDGQDIPSYTASMLASSTPPSIAIQAVVPFQNTAVLAAPTLNTPTVATTGGTLAAGPYFYKVTAGNNDGETIGSNERTVTTTGTTSKVTLTWNAISGANYYNIYRAGTTGQETYLETVYGTTTYVDDGSDTPGGSAPPSVSTASAPGQVQVIKTYCVPVTGRVTDIEFDDDSIGVFDPNNGLYMDRRAQNTFYNTATGGL